MRSILSAMLFLCLIAGGAYYYLKVYRSETVSNYRIAQVELGNMMPTIEATGTLEPEQVVDIGSQVNGLITELKVDYRSNVEAHQELAVIDPTLYQAAVDQNTAAVKSASANLGLAQANLALGEANLKRDDQLIKKGAIAPSQYDTDFAAREVAKATVGVQQAAINQAEAMLHQSQVNLGYCSIKSPVKGTIIDRRVNVGQDVVSSLSASSLFLLAKDLSQIQVWASVNEADIGRIQPGVKVHFTVDAFPNQTFRGEVSQVRLNATMTQNVVTYTVVVTTPNKDMKLYPYMTASLQFEIEDHENVLMVPNAALRWKPRQQQIAPDIRADTWAAMNRPAKSKDAGGGKKEKAAKGSGQAAKGSGQAVVASGPAAKGSGQTALVNPAAKGSGQGSSPATAAGTAAAPALATGKGQPPGQPISTQAAAALKEHYDSGRLWVADGNYVRPVSVKIIATDGTNTEVRGEGVSKDMEVVIGENVATDSDSDTTNPFMPKLFRGNANSKNSGSTK